jgi:hypothetical protein
MAQQDRGLVLRGLALLALVGGLATFVVITLFWRAETTAPADVTDLRQLKPSRAGWQIRYSAATALARRGDVEVPWPQIREMLDEKQQLRNRCEPGPDGDDIYDETVAHGTMLSALKALTAWHEKQRALAMPPPIPPELHDIYAAVDQLAQIASGEMKIQAEKARTLFFR